MKTIVEERGQPLRDLEREGLHHVGNSTHWIVLGGVSILTDPWLSEPADRTLGHRTPPSPLPMKPAVVLITHGHEDHFDPVALARLDRAAAIVVPRAQAQTVENLGFREVRACAPGERFELRGLDVEVVLGKHDIFEQCYRLERDGRSLFFGGDTMLTPEIDELARRRPVSLAIVPGERSSLLGMRFVMNPEEAVALAKRFGASRAVLTHHENTVTHRWPYGWAVRTPAVDRRELPDWFVVPSPGDHVAFPAAQEVLA